MRKKIKNNLIRISAIFVSAVLCMTMIRGGLLSAPLVKAETDRALNYDKTDVLDDLGSSAVDGKPFNVNDYPRNPFGTVQVITFAEYCYSQYENANRELCAVRVRIQPCIDRYSDCFGTE